MAGTGRAWKDGERQAAAMLQDLWGARFYRTEDSGGMATRRRGTLPKAVTDALTGDVACDPADPALTPGMGFPFCVEVKTRHDAIDPFEICRLGRKSELFDWWNQCCRDAARVGRMPLLLMKTVGRRWYAGVDSRFAEALAPEGRGEANDYPDGYLLDHAWGAEWSVASGTPEMTGGCSIPMTVIEFDRLRAFGREKIEHAAANPSLRLAVYGYRAARPNETKEE